MPGKSYDDLIDEVNDELGADDSYVDDSADEYDQLDDPIPGTSAERPVTAPQATTQPTSPAPDSPPEWAQGLYQGVAALGGMVHSLYDQQQQMRPQPQPEQRQPTRPVWDTELEPIAQAVQQLPQIQAELRESFKNRESERLDQAVHNLQKEYGEDFDKIVTPAQRENLKRQFLADADRMPREALENKYGFNRLGWQSQLDANFKTAHYSSLKAAATKQQEQANAEKETRTRNAARIPSGGAVHQPANRNNKPAQYTRGYSDIVRDVKAEFEAMYGG